MNEELTEGSNGTRIASQNRCTATTRLATSDRLIISNQHASAGSFAMADRPTNVYFYDTSVSLETFCFQ